MSGSTGWNNSVRSRLYLERVVSREGYATVEENPDRRVLRGKKANYGRIGDEIAMTWIDGVFVPDDVQTGTNAQESPDAKADRVFLTLLRMMVAQGRSVHPTSGATFAPKLFSEHPAREGVAKPAFRRAMERLLTEGTIKVGTTGGPPSKRAKCLLPVDPNDVQ